MSEARTDRQIIQTASTEFDPYDFDGPLQEDMSYLKLDYDMDSRQGAYLIRMEAGTETIAHEHKRREEYYILEGELIEDDGTVLRKGDYVIYQPGSYHNSRTETGCLILGIDYSREG